MRVFYSTVGSKSAILLHPWNPLLSAPRASQDDNRPLMLYWVSYLVLPFICRTKYQWLGTNDKLFKNEIWNDALQFQTDIDRVNFIDSTKNINISRENTSDVFVWLDAEWQFSSLFQNGIISCVTINIYGNEIVTGYNAGHIGLSRDVIGSYDNIWRVYNRFLFYLRKRGKTYYVVVPDMKHCPSS